ncbi:MAG: hypothetical protein J6U94_06945 [Paludibacteraceae bacterium]|nr:hypothetical protein [Paludibacteraceae bacterium]
MKAYKINLFIFSIIIVLAVICYIFPSEGIQIGAIELEFPSLSDVLGQEEDSVEIPSESPEELLARRLAEMRMQEEAQYLEYFHENAGRIHFPNDNISLFDPLFAALDEGKHSAVKILHFGDSQIEEDRISSMLRSELQKKFGGQGVGIMPAVQTIPTLSIGQATDYEMQRHLVYGPTELRATDNHYGIMGQRAQLDTTVHIRFYPRPKISQDNPSRYFTRLQVWVGNINGRLSVTCDGITQQADTTQPGMQALSFTLPDSTVRTALTLQGNGEIYGISLGSPTGVSIDNIPMRGCSGTIFTQMNSQEIEQYCRQNNVRLIILQYGGNSVPYLKKESGISNYAQQLERQIKYIKRLVPTAEVLFIGPSDMATKVKSEMQTYPHLPMVIDSIKHAALRAGAAYWDLYMVMGGKNSMVNWVNSQPPLAASDYVHFSRLGADKIGDMLCKSMMLYYDYYKWRNQKEVVIDDSCVVNIDSLLPLTQILADTVIQEIK